MAYPQSSKIPDDVLLARRAMKMNDSPSSQPVTPTVKRLQLGVFGRLFGDKDHAPFYVAGTLAFLLFGLLVAVAYFPVAALSPTTVCPLLTLTIGYMFGKSPR